MRACMRACVRARVMRLSCFRIQLKRKCETGPSKRAENKTCILCRPDPDQTLLSVYQTQNMSRVQILQIMQGKTSAAIYITVTWITYKSVLDMWTSAT